MKINRLISIILLIPFAIAAPLQAIVSNSLQTRESGLLHPGSEIFIHASDFVVPGGVVIDESSEGSQNLARITTGDKLSFTVNLSMGGLFRLQARISNAENVGAFVVVHSKTREIYGQVDVLPPTGGWDRWATVRVGDVNIPSGVQTLEILILDGGFNLGWFSFTLMDEATIIVDNDAGPNHFLVAATDFTYSEGITVDPLNGNLGETDPGDIVNYEINIPTLGKYALRMQVASLHGQGSFIALNSDTKHIYGQVDSIPETGGWHIWTTVSMEDISFEPGMVPLEILVVEGGWNMMHFSVELTAAAVLNTTDLDTTEVNATDAVHFLIPSASFNSSGGVEMEGPQIVGNIGNTAFLKYNLDVPVAGNYRLDLQVASANGSGAFLVADSDTQEIYGSVDSIPATGAWDNWTTVSVDDIHLPSGTVPLEIIIMEGGFNLLFMSLELNYATNNFLFNDSVSSNTSDRNDTSAGSGAYMIRAADFVSADGVVTEDPFNGTETVGSIDTGDTIDYDIDVSVAGTYRLDLGVASLLAEGSFMVMNRETREVYGQLDPVPATGDWYTWTKVSVGSMDLPAGTVPLRVVAIVGGWNLMWLSLELVTDSTAVVAPSIQSTKFFFPASTYDRMSGIELEPSSEGGENVGNIDAGDWLTYSVDLPESGAYKVEMRVASHVGLGSVEFVDARSQRVYGTLDIPSTGWWQIYTTISDELSLPGGSYSLQIRAREAGWNFLWFSLEKI